MRVLIVATLVAVWAQQADQRPAAAESPVRGLYNWIHSTGDAERSFSFYGEVFGIELARSPFAGVASANARPEPIRPVSQAGSDALVWALTNTHGSRFRTVFMRAANTPFGLELSEFFDVPRSERHANPWDPGASKLIFTVRDLNSVVARFDDASHTGRDDWWCHAQHAEWASDTRSRPGRLLGRSATSLGSRCDRSEGAR